MSKWTALVFLNLMAIVGSGGVVIWVGAMTHTWWGLVATVGLLVFVNWIWWSVHYNNFSWL